jgi:hypothetical protein
VMAARPIPTSIFPPKGSNSAWRGLSVCHQTHAHQLPLRERKAQVTALIGAGTGWLRYVDHHEGDGRMIHQAACRLGVEGGRLETGRRDLSAHPD